MSMYREGYMCVCSTIQNSIIITVWVSPIDKKARAFFLPKNHTTWTAIIHSSKWCVHWYCNDNDDTAVYEGGEHTDEAAHCTILSAAPCVCDWLFVNAAK